MANLAGFRPEKDIEDVEKQIQKLIKIKAEAEFPPSFAEKFKKEAKAEFRLFKVGEEVSFQLKNGVEVNGYLRELTKTNVLVDKRDIEISDIDSEAIVHFDETIREIKIREFMREKNTALKEQRTDYEEKIRKETSDKLYTQLGYILVKGDWIPKTQLVNERLETQRKKLIKNLRPLLRSKNLL